MTVFDAGEHDVLDALWLARWMLRPTIYAHGSTPSAGTPEVSEIGPSPALVSPNLPNSPNPPAMGPKPNTSDEKGSLYAGARESRQDEAVVPVRPVRIPAGVALPQGLEMVRGFRPLPRLMPSRVSMELDEEATAAATAENRMRLFPLLRPRMERWFDAALVVGQSLNLNACYSAAACFVMCAITGCICSPSLAWFMIQALRPVSNRCVIRSRGGSSFCLAPVLRKHGRTVRWGAC